MKAYSDDLAWIHDAGFGHFAERAAPALLALFRRRGIESGLVVDLGCGSGIWAQKLVEAGYDVFGVDVSEAMIRIARRRARRGTPDPVETSTAGLPERVADQRPSVRGRRTGAQRLPEAHFRVGSFLEVPLPACVAVTALGEVFNYLFDGRNTLRRLQRLFRDVHRALYPGGVFVFDVAEPGRGAGPPQKHFQGDGWAALVDVEEDPKRSLLTRRITTFRKVGALYRHEHEVHRLRLYKASSLAKALRETGFRVRTVRGYGELRFPRAYTGLIARKV